MFNSDYKISPDKWLFKVVVISFEYATPTDKIDAAHIKDRFTKTDAVDMCRSTVVDTSHRSSLAFSRTYNAMVTDLSPCRRHVWYYDFNCDMAVSVVFLFIHVERRASYTWCAVILSIWRVFVGLMYILLFLYTIITCWTVFSRTVFT